MSEQRLILCECGLMAVALCRGCGCVFCHVCVSGPRHSHVRDRGDVMGDFSTLPLSQVSPVAWPNDAAWGASQ